MSFHIWVCVIYVNFLMQLWVFKHHWSLTLVLWPWHWTVCMQPLKMDIITQYHLRLQHVTYLSILDHWPWFCDLDPWNVLGCINASLLKLDIETDWNSLINTFQWCICEYIPLRLPYKQSCWGSQTYRLFLIILPGLVLLVWSVMRLCSVCRRLQSVSTYSCSLLFLYSF